MPNRAQKATHDHIYRWIAARDGEHCLDPSCRKRPPQVRLEIDHADNNPDNWDPANLHLLCQRHNLKMRQLTAREHVKLLRAYSAINVSEREREIGNSATHAARELVDYNQGSVEMKANSLYERRFREWLLAEITDKGFIEKKDAVAAGAEIAGCNPITAARYLSKLTSSAGNLMETTDTLGVVVIVFRPTRPPATGTRRGGRTHQTAHDPNPETAVPGTRDSAAGGKPDGDQA